MVEDLGTLQGVKAKLHVDPTASPIFHTARPVPYALREKIEQDLERLETAGTMEPVQYSEWATPIVPGSYEKSWHCTSLRRLEVLQKQNFNIETIKGDLKIELIKSDNVNKQV